MLEEEAPPGASPRPLPSLPGTPLTPPTIGRGTHVRQDSDAFPCAWWYAGMVGGGRRLDGSTRQVLPMLYIVQCTRQNLPGRNFHL